MINLGLQPNVILTTGLPTGLSTKMVLGIVLHFRSYWSMRQFIDYISFLTFISPSQNHAKPTHPDSMIPGFKMPKQLLWPLKDLPLHPVPPSTHPWAWCLQVAPKRLHHKEKFNRLFAGPFYSSSSWEKGNEILTNTSPHGDQIHSLLSSLPGSQLHSLHCSFIPHYPVLEFSFLKKTNKGILPSSHGNFLLSFLEYFLCTKQKCVTTL